jgi:hypothetical protein
MRKPLEKEQNDLKNIFIIFIAVTLETIIITYPALCAIMGLGVKSAWSDTYFIVSLVGGLFYGLVAGLVFGLYAGLRIGFYTGLGVFIGFSARVIVGLLLWYAFRRIPEGFLSMIKGFFGLKQELKKYSFLRSLSSFLVGYVIIVLIFSLWFYAFYLEGAYFTEGKSNSPFFSVDNINSDISQISL